MHRYEYRVVPAPKRGEKAKGAKTTGDRFALALTHLMNDLGAEGWEYLRADTLPCEERVGLTGKTTTFQNMLVFRRLLSAETVETVAEDARVEAVEAPAVIAPEPVAEGTPRPLGPATGEGGKAPTVGPARPEMAAE